MTVAQRLPLLSLESVNKRSAATGVLAVNRVLQTLQSKYCLDIQVLRVRPVAL